MSKTQPPQSPHSIGLAPTNVQGCRVVGPISISFPGLVGVVQTYKDDLFIEEQDGTINAIQSLYYDNSNNFLPMTFVINETQQKLILPPYSEGFLPIFAMNGMSYTVSYAGSEAGEQGNAILTLWFFNTPAQTGLWFPKTGVTGFCASSGFLAGNTIASVNTNNNAGVFPNQRIYVDGFDLQGDLPTLATVINITITSPLITTLGQAGSASWAVAVPAGPGALNFSRVFPRPFMSGVGTAIPGGGFNSSNITLTVPAMGAGQTQVSANLYWHVK